MIRKYRAKASSAVADALAHLVDVFVSLYVTIGLMVFMLFLIIRFSSLKC